MKFLDLFTSKGTVGRGEYAFTGCLLFAVKYNLDRLVVALRYNQNWAIYKYLIPSPDGSLLSLSKKDASLFASLLVLALPFIWIGTTLTVRRLRSIGLPLWLVVLFFVPVVNLLFFIMLSLLPSKSIQQDRVHRKDRSKMLDKLIPNHPVGSAAVALIINVVSALTLAAFSIETLKNYGWGLFVGLPFCLGFTSVLLYAYHGPRGYKSCLGGFALLGGTGERGADRACV